MAPIVEIAAGNLSDLDNLGQLDSLGSIFYAPCYVLSISCHTERETLNQNFRPGIIIVLHICRVCFVHLLCLDQGRFSGLLCGN